MDDKNEYHRLHDNAVGHRRTNRPVLRFAGTGTFYHTGTQKDRFIRAMEAAEDFRSTFPTEVTIFYDRARGTLSPLSGAKWREKSGFHHDAADGREGFTVALRSDEKLAMTAFAVYLSVTEDPGRIQLPGKTVLNVPLPWIAENPDRCIAKIVDWCALLRPEQGTFGIGAVSGFATSVRNYGAELWPWIARFSGFDVDTALRFDRRDPHQALRAVNWLTIFDDVWVGKLGGHAAIAASLHSEGRIYPYEGGIVVRACTHPQMGDINMAGAPEAYIAVDRLIRPFRYLDYSPAKPMENLKVPDPIDPNEATLDWVTRFERLDPEAADV